MFSFVPEEGRRAKCNREMGLVANPCTDPPFTLLFFVLFFVIPSSSSLATQVAALKVLKVAGINVENPVVDVTPISSLEHGLSKDAALCERVQVTGVSRLKLRKYSSAYRLVVSPSVVIPERLHSKIQICFHRNTSLGLCGCEKDEWKILQKGIWTSVVSPYEERYIDVKFVRDFPGSVSVTLEEEFQGWRLLFLALGLVLLLLAPVVSSWVPFYYSSSMAIGICLVIIILLYQGMKLLPTGRKNIFYLTIYGSVLGAGSFLLRHFSMLVNGILVSFGLSEEMQNPVSVFLLVGITLAGAGLGYWLVRKFVISEDGSVDDGIAQFVKWAMRIIAAAFILQSTLDTPLALIMLTSCLVICYSVTSVEWHDIGLWTQSSGEDTMKHKRAEFLSRSGKKDFHGTAWNGVRGSSPDTHHEGLLSHSHRGARGLHDYYSPSTQRSVRNQQDYYSTFHRTPNRQKYTKQEWEDFTEESTRQAVSELASSPEFTDWMIRNADRIRLLPDESSDESIGSGSDSTDERAVRNSHGFGVFKWQRSR